MGYFSWMSADTNEQIKLGDRVFFLQPNGKKPIEEDWYDGYGHFGGVDCYEWLVDMNVGKGTIQKAKLLGIKKRDIGINIMFSSYYVDTRDGKKYSYDMSELFDDLNPFPGNYKSKVGGVEINDLIKENVFEKRSFEDYFGKINYPLKFSFDENAVYEDLPCSENDPNQGM